jgi:transcriptional regulator with XRE-family HTH domain
MKKKLKLHETLSRLLKERGMTLRRLSKESGVPPSNLSAWQVPGTKPKDVLQVAAVADVLGVSLSFLLFGKSEKKINLEELPTELIMSGVYRLRLERVLPQPTDDDEEE